MFPKTVMRCFQVMLVYATLTTEGFRILMLPIQMHSHVSNFIAIGKELVKNGHEVYTSSYEGHLEVDKTFGIKTVKLPCHDPGFCDPEAFHNNTATLNQLMFKNKGDVTKYVNELSNPIIYARKALLQEGAEFFMEVQKLHFDLVFVDGLFVFKWYYLVPHRMGVPFVSLSDLLDPIVSRQPWLPSFVPHPLMATSSDMTFIERTKNLFSYIIFYFVNFLPPISPEVIAEYREYGYFESLEELESRSLLFLQNSDDILDFPKPLMPNVVNIGGLTVKEAKPLQGVHREYADISVQGLIIVSFGSGIEHLPLDIAKKLISAFSKLKENVLWRFSNKQNLTIPKNVRLSDWIPQNDYMAHQNVRLMVTHCGKNGVYESVYHSKPLFGLPMQLEQRYNGAAIRHHGYGKTLDMFEFTAEDMYSSIREVIDNPVYQSNVQKASAIFKSQRQSPAQKAAYWIEHVLKFGGDHLRSHALNMPFYQYIMLDVLVTVIMFFMLIIFVGALILRMCCNYVCRRKGVSSSTEKKTN